ncbi:hypothetical protein NGM10_03390 [Halorussus salilacus]|uniref:hypothetical protein n=1 Tax=Halorussus salilacus TaxID=2953750 RepID=UPI00209E99AB|nr:hypothetical protein [Halorussus salilacus]USZ68787.1 hypothetical protein NGM10_03390 [Halorussus salilacus]
MSEERAEDGIDIKASDASLVTARKIAEEGRNTLEQQTRTLTDIDDKAIRIYRANVLLLSVIIGAMSLASDGAFSYFANLNSILGLLLLVVAIALAGITYTSSNLEIGVTHNDIRDAIEDDYNSKDLYFRLASGYADWIAENDDVLQENGDLMVYTIIVEVWALAYLSGGVVVTAIVNAETYFIFVHALLVCLCLAALFWNKIWLLESWSLPRYLKATGGLLAVGLLGLFGTSFVGPMEGLLRAPLRIWASVPLTEKRFTIDLLTAGLILVSYPFVGYSIYHLEY